jgi:AAA domain
VDGARWQQEAQARAAEHGLGSGEIDRLIGSAPRAAGLSPAAVLRSAVNRLSGREGLTEQHNTFARRHALAEIAGEFDQGSGVEQLETSTSGDLADPSVVALGEIDWERRFTTVDLLACEKTIIAGTARRVSERSGLVHPRLPDLVLADSRDALSAEQAKAVRVIATDGQGVSVLQALAGTGKTRVLGALARIYEAAGCQVIGIAPTGRAARELGDAAGVPAFTIHRLLADLEQSGGFAPRTVVLFDEAGTAPTRPSATLLSQADAAGTKVIAAGDSGQLPSVAAGGWFAAVADALGGPELRQVMRQRDPAERAALEALHDGHPEPYLALARQGRRLTVHAREEEALDAVLADWNEARQAGGLPEAVIIARDNVTRVMLNQRARQLLVQEGIVSDDGVVIADQTFAPGDRVIARRNDRYRDVDNGTLGRVTEVDHGTGAVTMATDSGERRELDVAYTAAHLEHAYALTGHGAHGATVEWAGVIGRPSEFTREWAYTSLARARARTRVYVINDVAATQREREEYAQPEPERTTIEALDVLTRAMRRREAESLAVEQVRSPDFPDCATTRVDVPLAELAEAGAEQEDRAIQAANVRGPQFARAWFDQDRGCGVER